MRKRKRNDWWEEWRAPPISDLERIVTLLIVLVLLSVGVAMLGALIYVLVDMFDMHSI